MSFKYLSALLAMGLLISCKSGLQNSATLEGGETWEVKPLKAPLIVFNWSRGGGNLIDHLSTQIDQAAKLNLEVAKGARKLPGLAMMGMGLYVANDPLLSIGFGNELSCLEVRDNTEFLKAKDAILGDLDSKTAVSRTEPALIYSWGTGLIPLREGGSTSGVIRDRSVIDLNKSKKIDFSKSSEQNGIPNPAEKNEYASIKLDERALKRAATSLNRGRFCEAFQVFENNLPALYYSSLAGIRAVRSFPKNEKFATFISSRALFNAFIPKLGAKIFENEEQYLKIRQDLIDLKLLSKDELDKGLIEWTMLRMILVNAINARESDDWSAQKTTIMAQVINLSQMINVPVKLSTPKELSIKIEEEFDLKLVHWEKENKEDFEFSKKLWKYWIEHSMSSFITNK